MSALVKDIMTTHVVAVRKYASFKDIAISLREHRVSAFPVLDEDDKVIGVVSEADLLTKEALVPRAPGLGGGRWHHKDHVKAAGVTAGDLMSAPPVTARPLDTIGSAARLMYGRKVKRLPVIDADGRLVGIVSRSDVLSVYSRPDADIRAEITERVMLEQLLTDPARFTLTVADGIVTVEGVPETAANGHDMIEEIRHVEGVVSVRDRLSYPSATRRPFVADARY